MSFSRTRAGLVNLNRFLGVKYVLFTEGGNRAVPIAEVESGAANSEALDVLFWRTVIHECVGDVSLSIRPVGCKSILMEIVGKLGPSAGGNVFVAMDTDYQALSGGMIEYDYVVYTRGYSWENDVWEVDNVTNVLMSLLDTDVSREAVKEEVAVFFDNLQKAARWPVRADYLLTQSGSSLFDRSKPKELLVNPPKPPALDLPRIRKKLAYLRAKKFKSITLCGLDWRAQAGHLCGKVVAAYFELVIRYSLRTRGIKFSLSTDALSRMVIMGFKHLLNQGVGEYSELSKHYRREFSLMETGSPQ